MESKGGSALSVMNDIMWGINKVEKQTKHKVSNGTKNR